MSDDRTKLDDLQMEDVIAFLREAVAVVGEGHTVVIEGHRVLASGYRDMARGMATLTDRVTRPRTATLGAPDPSLPNGERELLRLLAEDKTPEQVARALGVTTRTVGRRLKELRDRAGTGSEFCLAIHAMASGWLVIPEQPTAGKDG